MKSHAKLFTELRSGKGKRERGKGKGERGKGKGERGKGKEQVKCVINFV
jgi:hypothetical protein